MKNIKSIMILSGLATGIAASPSVYADVLGNTKVSISGYIKADAMISSYSNGTLPSGSIGRDFYLPGLTPVGGEKERAQYDAHVRQSRFRFTANSLLANSETITGVLELDFHATPDGNERVSNSYEPRIRHAFIQYKNWLIGQTWSTFQDVTTLPESLDFIGATDGTIFNRQTMLRYSNGGFQLALENPETTITPFQGGARIVADDNSVPDLIGRYTHKQDWGHIAVAGMLRQLAYENKQADAHIDASDTGYGLSITSKIKFGADDLRIMANIGSGLGRYIGLNVANGAVLDEQNELQAIDSMGYAIAYRHVWSETWRSNIIYSAFSADYEPELTGGAVTSDTWSARVNLLHSPSPELTFGAEYAYANREIEAGADGNMNRLQFSAKYAF